MGIEAPRYYDHLNESESLQVLATLDEQYWNTMDLLESINVGRAALRSHLSELHGFDATAAAEHPAIPLPRGVIALEGAHVA
jgi:hypothetical protein